MGKLYCRDKILICHGWTLHAGERAIVFKFGEYFDELTHNLENVRNMNLCVDCEYDRHLNDIKRIDWYNEKRKIVPDIVWHQRNTDRNNILAIEFKGWWNHQSRENDKIKKLCQEPYNYQYGVRIDFAKEQKNVKVDLYYQGVWEMVSMLNSE